MATYGGIVFNVMVKSQEGTSLIPVLKPADFGVVRQKLPYADMEQIQITGRGNSRFTLSCEVFSDADFASLMSLVSDGTPRTLVDPFGIGVSYTNMLLQDIPEANRVSFAQEVIFTAVFEQVSST